MNQILINPHNCSRQEQEELKIFLNKNSWDWHEIISEEEEVGELDLSREVCHACGSPLVRNLHTRTEKCVHYACLLRNIEFTIPFIETEEDRAWRLAR